jgi:hypothetical protein
VPAAPAGGAGGGLIHSSHKIPNCARAWRPGGAGGCRPGVSQQEGGTGPFFGFGGGWAGLTSYDHIAAYGRRQQLAASS